MTIGFTIILTSIARGIFSLFENTKGKDSLKKIAVIGTNDQAVNICREIQNSETMNADIVGILSLEPYNSEKLNGIPIMGTFDYLPKFIEEYKINEIIITDPAISANEVIRFTADRAFTNVRFHVAQEYEELIAARIINDITGIEPTIPNYNIAKLRFRIVKRIADIIISILSFTLGLPIIIKISRNNPAIFSKLWFVLMGSYSFIGLYETDGKKPEAGKPGIITLADVSRPERLTPQSINNLNAYYNRHFNLSLDLDIFFKFIFRKKSGN